MYEGLTNREYETLKCIESYIDINGYAPSLRDISSMIYTSTTVAKKYIEILQDKNYLKYTPHVARSYVLTKRDAC